MAWVNDLKEYALKEVLKGTKFEGLPFQVCASLRSIISSSSAALRRL